MSSEAKKKATPDYLKRMFDELRDLSDRRQKLDDFLETGSNLVTSAEFSLMADQLVVMVEYEQILEERITIAKRKEGIE